VEAAGRSTGSEMKPDPGTAAVEAVGRSTGSEHSEMRPAPFSDARLGVHVTARFFFFH
jgi:hypothetical protein